MSDRLNRKVAVIGLGYVGLPVAVAFGLKGYDVTGFDINEERVAELKRNADRTNEIDLDELKRCGVKFSSDKNSIKNADFYIVTVPTPVDDAQQPDLKPLHSASHTVGSVLKRGDIVVYESTVFPGATEEECVPILEKVSGLRFKQDFGVGYSPERINPGDKSRRFESILKIVSGSSPDVLDVVAALYGSVVKAGIYRASTLKVAEAAKVIENTQRDLNIALMNEFSVILSELGIDTFDVLEAAGTKWNFLNFTPGMPGGHCIPVDPYYLTYRAQKAGLHPEVILAGRRINDRMPSLVALHCAKALCRNAKASDCVVTVLGLTFKENVPDIRNSKTVDLVEELRGFGFAIQVHDAFADPDEVLRECDVELMPLEKLKPADAVIIAVPHSEYIREGWTKLRPLLKPAGGLLMDLKANLSRNDKPADVTLWRP
jgi:UDP-N-acetyl-D-galactosamine dehydrogenase